MKKENEMEQELQERLALGRERIRQIPEEAETALAVEPQGEGRSPEAFARYFAETARILQRFLEESDFVAGGGLDGASLEELAERNRKLYEDVLPGFYEKSWANP